MKKEKNWRTTIIDGVLIITLVFGMTSCGDSTKPEDPKDTAEEHNEAKFDDNKTENDAQFLVDAAEINLMEIQLGNLAAEKGIITEVKEMEKMVADVHSKIIYFWKNLFMKNSCYLLNAI